MAPNTNFIDHLNTESDERIYRRCANGSVGSNDLVKCSMLRKDRIDLQFQEEAFVFEDIFGVSVLLAYTSISDTVAQLLHDI